jgi:hypothetical protein
MKENQTKENSIDKLNVQNEALKKLMDTIDKKQKELINKKVKR